MRMKSKWLGLLVLLFITLFTVSIAAENETSPNISEGRVGKKKVYCPSTSEIARSYYNQAIQYVEEKNVDKAIATYLKAIEADITFCDAMDNLGRLYRVLGHIDKAIYWYKRSIAIHPNNPVSRMNLGLAYRLSGKYELAFDEYQHVLQIDKNDPEGYYGIGQIYSEQKRYVEAIDNFRKAEDLYIEKKSPLLIDPRRGIAVAYYMLNNFNKSAYFFELIYPETNTDPKINFMLGLCYLNSTEPNLEKSKQYFLRARSLGAILPHEVIGYLNIENSNEKFN